MITETSCSRVIHLIAQFLSHKQVQMLILVDMVRKVIHLVTQFLTHKLVQVFICGDDGGEGENVIRFSAAQLFLGCLTSKQHSQRISVQTCSDSLCGLPL